jgi:hypothetical protein
MIGLDGLDLVQTSSLRGWMLGFCGPACAVMFTVLFRLGLYTGRTGHQMGGHARHAERVA